MDSVWLWSSLLQIDELCKIMHRILVNVKEKQTTLLQYYIDFITFGIKCAASC